MITKIDQSFSSEWLQNIAYRLLLWHPQTTGQHYCSNHFFLFTLKCYIWTSSLGTEIENLQCCAVTFHDSSLSYSCVYPALQKLWIFRNTSISVLSPSVDPSREAWRRTVRLMSDRTAQPIRSPSASASLPPHGSRGRAGRLPKRGVRVGVNG